MKYISTRGQAPALSFEDVVLTGLASDGGLYVPESLPQFSQEEIASWAGLSYTALAHKIMWPFVEGCLTQQELAELIDKAYAEFRHPAVAPLVQLDRDLWVLELFQGPTLAFKDFALQFLGQLLDFILARRQQRVVVLGATSGDTGSAAIEGCKHCQNLDIFILHPHLRVSGVQRRQMTTVLDDNVHNIAIEGNFDDCQSIVKASFAAQGFLPEGRQLVAVNSINWARIMAQIVYYFYAALSLGGPHRKVAFAVPTGNFGDVFAGYLAKNMGLPVDNLLVATNANDILHRCISANDYSVQALQHSLSPSMDIMVSSNFERLLFDAHGRNGAEVARVMNAARDGHMVLGDDALAVIRKDFTSFKADDDQTVATIADVFANTGYLLDPHTAIGVEAARALGEGRETPIICLATAHPAKFPEAVRKAGYHRDPDLPEHMSDLFEREERFSVLDNSIEAVKAYISENVQ